MSDQARSPEGRVRWIRVWDLPTRLFHWLLVVLFAFSWWSGEQGGAWLDWHFLSGYAILTLLLFRIAWGFLGSSTSRFADFLKGPRAALHHLREALGPRAPQDVGHNPLGGWMIAVLLVLLLVQTGTGLFAEDRELNGGPLSLLVADRVSRLFTAIHSINVNLLLALVGLHVLAVLIYLFARRQNLIRPMVTGRKQLGLAEGNEPRLVSPWRALALLIAAAAIVYGIVHLG